ncbi:MULTISPECIES: phosphoribosylglycinamide formyltransferase [Syntrophotalea]|uniref:Phosphoribosylglycinamide formyltransferase n=1 Tax=Syntrophotalea acetylenica TaxID=29542 RepID=A0A1L3GHZ0_SYNAC|nr:phosphoribosylglycinamide formyltransferase [Syntrophotalea acetylenica]APG25520.1 phosphoribosylglycinamide formyltransferase [Syntrophotalea acetylenica]APG43585.1 phosphoribosylglycinamide formyltransferase [Syntrophotalea acetylenica]
MNKKLRLGVLASGGGTNLQAIIDRCREGKLAAEVVLVLSNKPQAGALQRARSCGIPAVVVDHRHCPDREAFDRRMVDALRQAEVDLVILAGFMRILTPVFLSAFPQRIMNIHPGLLPAFPGIDAQRQALEYGVKLAGCTVHFVDPGVDTGPIIIQAAVPVLDDDDESSLARRILEQEHRIYPRAIQLYAEGRLRIEGRRVRIDQKVADKTALASPAIP